MLESSDVQSESQTILAFKLSAEQFTGRFSDIKSVEDPYGRYADICSDAEQPGQRVAVRRYIADDDDKRQDVLESTTINILDMESYLQLSELDGMSHLVAFCFDPDHGEVHAAFEYNDHSLE
jgi:hypothetical protein